MTALVLALLLGAAVVYVVGWWRLGRRADRPVATWRLAAALAALATIATALVSPLDGLAHERFSAHMVQHLLLLTVAAPLGLLANPFPVLMWALPGRARIALRPLLARGGVFREWLRALTDMPVAWILFAITIWLWHVPVLYDRALGNDVIHALEHATLFGAALVFWWPLLAPAPHVRPTAHPGAAVAYVVLAGFQSAGLGLGLMLWPRVLYTPYAGPAAGALDDQAWGGLLMWAVSGVVDMAVVMALLWKFLAAGERARGFLDPSPLMREDRVVSSMTVDVAPKDSLDCLLSARGLRKAYGRHLVLDGIDLDVRRGEAVALLGANGAGKTTFLRIAATLVRPTSGRVIVAGADSIRDPETARRGLGFLGHGSWLYEDLTALENLRFWSTLGGHETAIAGLRAALAAVELDRWSDARVRTFSAGMKRRLAIARLVVARPRVLLLDEPFSGLDVHGSKWLEEHLQLFKSAGGAVVMSTHSFGRGFGVADRAAILAGGRLAADVAVATLGADGVRRLYDLAAEEGT